jgi:hypothetical protein
VAAGAGLAVKPAADDRDHHGELVSLAVNIRGWRTTCTAPGSEVGGGVLVVNDKLSAASRTNTRATAVFLLPVPIPIFLTTFQYSSLHFHGLGILGRVRVVRPRHRPSRW